VTPALSVVITVATGMGARLILRSILEDKTYLQVPCVLVVFHILLFVFRQFLYGLLRSLAIARSIFLGSTDLWPCTVKLDCRLPGRSAKVFRNKFKTARNKPGSTRLVPSRF
jgi:hypothetical protein